MKEKEISEKDDILFTHWILKCIVGRMIKQQETVMWPMSYNAKTLMFYKPPFPQNSRILVLDRNPPP